MMHNQLIGRFMNQRLTYSRISATPLRIIVPVNLAFRAAETTKLDLIFHPNTYHDIE